MPRKTNQRDYGLGSRLREERLRTGLSSAEFAATCGVSRVTQFNYEYGRRSPDGIYLSAADAAGVDVSYIVTGRHAGDPRPPMMPGADKFAAEVLAAILRTLAKVIGESHAA